MAEEEESIAALLNDSDDEEEENVYKMLNGPSSQRNGFLLKQKIKNHKRVTTAWLIKGALLLSFLLNVILFIVVLLSKNTKSEWNNSGDPVTDKQCTPLQSQSSSQSSPTSVPSTSLPSSSSSFSSLTSRSNETTQNISSGHNIEKDKDSSQVQQRQQNSQQHQGKNSSCATSTVNIPLCGVADENNDRTEGDRELTKRDDLSKEYQNIFADLTIEEMKAAVDYLLTEPTLNVKVQKRSSSCFLKILELHTPNKTEALLYLDSYAPKPPREADAMIVCKYSRPPVVKELVIGPLPNPTYHKENPRRKDSNIPYKFSPDYGVNDAYSVIFKEFANSPDLKRIVSESYGVSDFYNCKNKCIALLPQMTSSAYNDNVVITITAYYATEFVTINPLDLIFITKEMLPYGKVFTVTGIFYGGQNFKSSAELIRAYNSGTVKKTRMTFPEPEAGQSSVPGTINLRGTVFPKDPKAGPKSYEPDGKRYSIKDQHVNYLLWSFNIRLTTESGPQLWDVRWGDERIAYEISLQDVGVIYAGANPMSFFAHLSDSAFGLGNKASGLLPGLDCPEGATFLSKTLVSGHSGKAFNLPHSQCVFEHNTERPLRRHMNADGANGRNHGGLVDRVLIVRSIIVEYNYDYIFDMIFHQNGALELKTYATGYVMSQHYYNGEKPFGFKIHSDSVGSIHHHIFNYKIDLDILGTSNRYETLDLVLDERPWPWYHNGEKPFQQISFQHNLRKTEMEGILRYNYSKPKYHIVYNDEQRNPFGNHRAFRIATKGFSKQVLPDDSPVLNSRHWAKYDMLVTRRKDTEEKSSSRFSMYDGASPHVDIDRYLEDNETIVDEDLVFWLTVGMHHIPHTEDIPNTPTVGTEAVILITPYNYFKECPSVGSRDSIRVDRKTKSTVSQDYGIDWNRQCIPTKYNITELLSSSAKMYSIK